MKAHIARSGAHAGDYVRCPAKVKCTVASETAHANFNGEKEIKAYNDLSHSASEFSDNSCVSALFGGDPVAGLDSEGNAWETEDEDFGPTGVPTDGEMGAVVRAANESQEELYGLRNGKTLDKEDYDGIMERARSASDAIWGGHEGMTTSSPSDVTLNGGGTVHLDEGWKRRMGADFKTEKTDYGEVTHPSYDVFSDGSTAASVITSADGDKSVNLVSRKNQNVMVNRAMGKDGSLNLDGNTGKPLDEVHDAVRDELGTDNFVFRMNLSKDGDPEIRINWNDGKDDDVLGYHQAKNFLAKFPKAGNALKELNVKGISQEPTGHTGGYEVDTHIFSKLYGHIHTIRR